jgi:hypothetical protein
MTGENPHARIWSGWSGISTSNSRRSYFRIIAFESFWSISV